MAAVFFAAHLAGLPKTLEDFDSINFALGVRDFDVARHQPHPPGYPIYIALAKASTAVFRAAGVDSPEPRGLAIWGALSGALAAFPLFSFFRRLEGQDRCALGATIVSLGAPLFWFTASRPLSDMTGLAAVTAAQALAVTAWVRLRDPTADPAIARRMLLAAAAVSGLAIGIRAQTFVLTLPLLGLVLADRRVPPARRAPIVTVTALLAGVLAWAIPLLVASGGPRAYLTALGQQGAGDFSGVVMLWTHPGLRNLAFALRDTFVLPWAPLPLAVVVLTLAVIGAGVLARRSGAALLVIAVAAVPYTAFHLLFQETATVRYALPLVPATAYLTVVAIEALATVTSRVVPFLSAWLAPIATSVLVAASLWTTVPALRAYAANESPVFRAFSEMAARVAASGVHPAVVIHRDSKRAVDWLGAAVPGTPLPVRRSYEWLAAVQYWLEGNREPVWFLARPDRTDLALIDPAHRVLAGSYRWPFDGRVFTGGARPGAVDWYDITSPGWFLDRGWSLTPEVGGVTKADGDGPHVRPTLGYLARRPGEAILMIGGVNRGSAGSPPVRIRVEIDGRAILEWDQPAWSFFLRMQPLPAGALAGAGGFARLAISASSGDGRPSEVKLEQFDLQPPTALVWGFDDGWMEPEADPIAGRQWMWAGGRSVLTIHHAGRDVTIRLRGESPLRYFDAPPHVTVKAGDRTILAFSPDRDFDREFTVPADALAAANGQVVMETDRTFQPKGDTRVLGLKMYEVTVK